MTTLARDGRAQTRRTAAATWGERQRAKEEARGGAAARGNGKCTARRASRFALRPPRARAQRRQGKRQAQCPCQRAPAGRRAARHKHRAARTPAAQAPARSVRSTASACCWRTRWHQKTCIQRFSRRSRAGWPLFLIPPRRSPGHAVAHTLRVRRLPSGAQGVTLSQEGSTVPECDARDQGVWA